MERDGEEPELPAQRVRRGRPGDRRPEDILTPKQYVNYQHGRILSGLLVFFGGIFALVAIVQLVAPVADSGKEPPALWAVMAVLGLAGVVGGAAAYQGNRAWARLAYLFVAILIFGCPIGTILSILWLMGLSRHLAAAELVRRARAEEA